MSGSPHTSTRISNIPIDALTGFTNISHLGGLNTTFLSQVFVLGTAPSSGRLGRADVPRTERDGEEPPMVPIQLEGQQVVTSSQ